jgi:hypothetical protein
MCMQRAKNQASDQSQREKPAKQQPVRASDAR